MKGATPPGTAREDDAADWIRAMFGRVVAKYDLLNHFLSFGVDCLWRRRTVRRLREVLSRQDVRVMDLCCGTGDLLKKVQSESRAPVIGCDFCHPMLVAAQKKIAGCSPRPLLFEADALRLPLKDSSLDILTVAFGFRNLTDYRAGLVEMLRVLRPSGTAAILEFSRPPNAVLAMLYNFYSSTVIPFIGGLVSGSREAYSYLPDSVRKFPDPVELALEMQRAGFRQVVFERMTCGIVTLHVGRRPEAPASAS